MTRFEAYCDVTESVTLSDRDRVVTVPRYKRVFSGNKWSFVEFPCPSLSTASLSRAREWLWFRLRTLGLSPLVRAPSHLLHAPPSSHRRLQWPSASCACTSAMHSRNEAPASSARNQTAYPQKRRRAWSSAQSDCSLRRHRPLLHRADLGYQVCGDGTRAILSHGTTMR